MILARSVATLALACLVASAHAQASPTTDWATFGRFLAVLQTVMQAAASDDPKAGQRAIDDLMSGRNPEANALLLEMLGEVPPAERERMISIGRSMLSLSQKQIAAQQRGQGDSIAIQARKDLTAMGLVYHDKGQFLDAVRRNDVLAVRLFLAGRGVDATARDALGSSALELARRGGNAEMIALLAAAASGTQ